MGEAQEKRKNERVCSFSRPTYFRARSRNESDCLRLKFRLPPSGHLRLKMACFVIFLFSEPAEATFTNLSVYNPGEASNLKYSSANLPKEQLSVRPDCTNLTSPPHPYSCRHYSPRMRNFSPGAPPNITVGSPALPRMIVPLPDQPNLFLNFPATYHPVVTQVSSFQSFLVHFNVDYFF